MIVRDCPDVLTEFDLFDGERNEYQAMAACEDCDAESPIIDLHFIGDGLFLCTPCYREAWINER